MKIYYYIINETRSANRPTVKHPSLQEALIEAERLARAQPTDSFVIVQSYCTVACPPTPPPVITSHTH